MRIKLQEEIKFKNISLTYLNLKSYQCFELEDNEGRIYNLSSIQNELRIENIDALFRCIASAKTYTKEANEKKLLLAFDLTLQECLTNILIQTGFDIVEKN